VPLIVDPQG
jgi:dynein heavy chain